MKKSVNILEKHKKSFINIPITIGIIFLLIGLFFFFLALKKIRIIWLQYLDQFLWIALSLAFLLIANVLITYGWNKNIFKKRYSLCISYTESIKGEKTRIGLFRETIESFLRFLVIIMISIGFLWIIHLIGNWLIYPFCFLVVIYSIKSLYKEKWAIIFHILFVPFMIIQLFFGIRILAAFMGILMILAIFWKKKLKQVKKRKAQRLYLIEELSKILKLIKSLNLKLHEKIYDRGTVQSFQSICISFVVLFFVVGPFLVNLLPEKHTELLTKYDALIKGIWDYIPYLTFIFYMGLSTAPLLEFFVRPISFIKEEESALKRGGNFFLAILIAFSILPIFLVLSLTIAVIIVALGDSILGIKFAIIIGFFVFPKWATKIFAIVPTLALFIYPKKMLLKWID